MAIPVNPVTLYEGQPYILDLGGGGDPSTDSWPASYGTFTGSLDFPASAGIDYKAVSYDGTLAGVSPFRVVTYADGAVEGEEHFGISFSVTTDHALNPIETTNWVFTLLDASDWTGTSAAEANEGTPGADKLSGAGGNDSLKGLGANDTLNGGKGGDQVTGGDGKDKVTGGGGHDVFLFDEAGNANADTLTDFQVGIDKIALDNDRFGKLGATIGELNPENFWSGAEAHAASDRVIYDTVSGKLYYDPDGTGEKAQVLIATLSDSPDDVSAADFKVI